MKRIYTLAALSFIFFSAGHSVSAQSTTQTYNFTGTQQMFIVPNGVTSIDVDMAGASGGDIGNLTQAPNGVLGGHGGRLQCTFGVTPGATLYVYVGGRGRGDSLTLSCFTATGGYNGGGDGFGGYNSYNYNSGGGGGASDIRIGGTNLTDRKLIVGGGGGSGCSGCTGGGAIGGDGGGLQGDSGQSMTCFPNCNFGFGGTQVGGGAMGVWACQTMGGTSGALGVGGLGCANGPVTCGSGGGGGGGYYGGGGGSAGPGGGGSSYTDPSATAIVHTKGYQYGNGFVKITYLNPSGIVSYSVLPDLNLFPNPFNDILRITTGDDTFRGKMILLNSIGEEIFITDLSGAEMTVDLSDIAAGIYFIRIMTTSGIVTKKLIKN